jgi:membrane protein
MNDKPIETPARRNAGDGETPAHRDAGDANGRQLLRRARRYLTAFLRKHNQDAVSIHAMSLTYTTILSMVPLLAVTFSVLKAFGIHNQVEPFLARTLAPLGSEGVVLSERITEFVRNLQVGVLGAVGVAGLFYTVVSLVGSIENALNHIWQARRGRSWPRKVRDYLTVIMIGPVLVFTALALIAAAEQNTLVQRAFTLAPSLVWLATVLLPYLILTLAFTLLFRFMPNTFVTWSAAAVGGTAAGVGWKLAGSTFTAFVAGSSRYAAIYSSFAILVLFFIWIYVSWSIVLIGAQIAYLWQYPADVLSRLREATMAARERNGLRVLVTLARAHLGGEPPIPPTRLALRAGLPSSAVAEVVEQMIERGVLLHAERPPGIALAKPSESIPVAELLEILRGEDDAPPPRPGPATVDAVLERRRRAARDALDGLSLRDLTSGKE